MSEKIKVLFVCLGNICRSPTAEGVFRTMVEKSGWQDVFQIDSAGTAAYYVGEPPDRRRKNKQKREVMIYQNYVPVLFHPKILKSLIMYW
jgi:protein-tyrosine phosphatase